MDFFQLLAILMVLAALFSYVNCRYIRFPTTIGIMSIALAASLALIALSNVGVDVRRHVAPVVEGIDFGNILLHGMLAFLLFAGALHLDLGDLAKDWRTITLLAVGGTLVSTFIVGGATYVVLGALGLGAPFVWCLLFGALISPTDPISVLGIMKHVGCPKALQTRMTGESLFNDGFAVVIFVVVLDIATGHGTASVGGVAWMLVKEMFGGSLLGMAGGMIAYRMLLRVDNYQVEVLITLALSMGVYALADAVHASAPIAVVVAGLLIGNQGRAFAMSKKTEEHLDTFWELLDEILNAVLFLLIGVEVIMMRFQPRLGLAAAVAIAVTLAARWAGVTGALTLVRAMGRPVDRGAVTVLTWGGLRGGISVAMALALPISPYRDRIVAVTYVVVVFSILVQGLTIGWVIRRVTQVGSAVAQTPQG